MIRRAALVLALLGVLTVPAGAQKQPDRQVQPDAQGRLPVPRQLMSPPSAQASLDLQRRVFELERLLAVGSLARAEGLLESLMGHRQLERKLVPLRIRLARLKGDHESAATIAEAELARRPRQASLWRELVQSRLNLDETTSARAAIDSFLVHSPQRRSATVVAVDMVHRAGRPRMTVALIDSLRPLLSEPGLLSRQRAFGLLADGRQNAAADELVGDLRRTSMNLTLLRTGLLEGPFDPASQDEFLERLERRAAEPVATREERVLLMDLRLAAGDARRAGDWAATLAGDRDGRFLLLQNAATLDRELPLLADPVQRQAVVDHVLPILEDLAGPDEPDPGRRRQAATVLASVCGQALELGALGADPHLAAERFSDLLDTVRAAHPGSARLHAVRIRLATFTRDELGEAALAARHLESMLLDLDLSTEGVALVRLTLGECYLAAGDTARGRTVLTSLGRDRDFRQAAGHAHYHLARLDLAEGHYATARDRFAAVALDNPAASYANEALALGLAVAEELDNPSGGPVVLELYTPSVYYDLVARPEARRRSLGEFVDGAAVLVDTSEPQRLLERGRWELAQVEIAAGDHEAALNLLATITAEHAAGRYPAAALAETARLLAAADRPAEARAALERLLTQYPDDLVADDARDRLRSLP